VYPLDDSTDAVYLYGTETGRAPGWYLRVRMGGSIGRFMQGPFDTPGAVEQAHRSLQAGAQVQRAFTEIPALTIHAADDVAMAPPATWKERAAAYMAIRHVEATQDHDYYFAGTAAGPAHVDTGGAQLFVVNPAALVVAKDTPRIDDFVKLEAGLGMVLGPRVHVASFCHLGIGGGITILEEGASTGSGAKIVSGSAVPSEVGCSAIQPGVVNVRSFAWMQPFSTLYAGAILLPGCVLGARSVLAAGSVLKAGTVTGEDELWAGTPAVLKRRGR
jgi:acetyltransferase-like isoleucine patch superfamily enzyme